MTPRTRRYVGAAVALIALLLLGRWTVAFVAERWWAATISPAAAAFVTRWQLLGLACDAGAVVVASFWFVLQAVVVARAIASVQVTHRLGNIHLREAVPTRLLLIGAVASGVLLGLITGAGAHAWRDSFVLAWHGVTYGVVDPLLNLDVGVFVAQLPAWDLLHQFVALLGVLGFAFCFALYSGIGALKRENGSVLVHPDARRHLGALAAFIAVAIAAAYRIEPYHIAATALPTLTMAGALTRIHAAQVVAGIALATAILSLIWALRGRNSLLGAAWFVLAVAALAERYAVPALAEGGPPSPARIAVIRRFDALAWGIRQDSAVNQVESTPATTAIWDEALLGRMVERAGGVLEAATPVELRGLDGQRQPVWLAATGRQGDSAQLDVLAAVDGVTMASGAPVMLRSPRSLRPDYPVWLTVPDARSRPAGAPWRAVSNGVAAGSPLRRVLLAWARQAPGLLGGKQLPDVDWHLDPADRANAVLPMLSWLPADLVLLNGRPVWLVEGMLTKAEFPMASRSTWRDLRVAGVTPAVLCTVDVASGETRFYADPAADSLAAAWQRVIGAPIASAAAIPPEILGSMVYRAEWLQAQLPALAGPGWSAGQLPRDAGSAPVPVWQDGRIPGYQVALAEPGRNQVSTVVTASRHGGAPSLRIDRRNPDVPLIGTRSELRLVWNQGAVVSHLKDSVSAAGDTVWARPLRWHAGPALAVWQPVFAIPRIGPPSLLWVSTELGDRIGGGRTAAEAWLTVTAPDQSGTAHQLDDGSILESARRAVQRADSAFRRGDMTAFGRAFEELRRALQRPTP